MRIDSQSMIVFLRDLMEDGSLRKVSQRLSVRERHAECNCDAIGMPDPVNIGRSHHLALRTEHMEVQHEHANKTAH